MDPFSTEQYVESGPFAQTLNVCDRDKIQRALTLSDVVDLTLCNNPQTRALWAASRQQAAQLGTRLSDYLPTLSANASINRNNNGNGSTTTRNAGLTLSYLLFDFGGRSANVESAKQLLIATNASRDAGLQSLYLSAVESYYNVLSSRASVESAQIAETSAQKSLDAAEVRYQAGVGTPADRLQARTALSQAVLNRIRAEGAAASAQGTLANVMGFDAAQPFTLAESANTPPDIAAERDIGTLIEQARTNRPDLHAAEAQIKAAESNLAATKASGWPSINLNASLGKTNVRDGGLSTTTSSDGVGVSISMPIFNGFQTTYQVRAARAQLDGRVAERDRLANQVALDVWNSYQTLMTNSQALRAANDLLASAEQSERVALGRYQAGLGSILDVLNAQSALANARQQQVNALYTFQFSRFALAQSMGQLDLTQTIYQN